VAIEDEIKDIEEEIRKTPYNKASQHHIGKLKAKLSKLKAQQMKAAKVGKAQALGYGLRKSGDATVILVGFPSVGKSTLLNALTNAKSEVAAYEFTTLTVVPGAMNYKGAKIQLFDVPGLVSGAAAGKGRGKEVLSVIRNADLIVIMADANKPQQLEEIKKELYEANIRLDQKPPNITIKKQSIGGFQIDKVSKVDLSRETIISILSEFGIYNAHVIIREPVTLDQFVDVVSENRLYVPSISVLNKVDEVQPLPKIETDLKMSAKQGAGIEELRKLIYKKLGFIRIFMKRQGKKADLEEPLIMRKGATVEDVCLKLHRAFRDNFRYANVWGKSAKHPGQKAGLRHVLQDRDILLIIKKE
jgi:small GTP-binding protein